jgi:hypothetical protein
MSTLYALSCYLGKAMNLPSVFFRKIPLSHILDKRISLRLFVLTLPSPLGQRKHKQRAKRPGNHSPHTVKSLGHIVLEGPVTFGSATKFSINGTDFTVACGTWIIGDLRIGVSARVKGVRHDAEGIEASSVVILQGA